MAYFYYFYFYLYKEILIKFDYKQGLLQPFQAVCCVNTKDIDINYKIESTVKFNGLKMSLITFCKRDPQMTFVPILHIY